MQNLAAAELIHYKNNLLHCTASGDIEISRDNGFNWSIWCRHSSYTGKFQELLKYENELLAITDIGLYYSRDDGFNWSLRYRYSSYTGNFSTIAVSGNELIAQSREGFFYSRDKGHNWSKRSF